MKLPKHCLLTKVFTLLYFFTNTLNAQYFSARIDLVGLAFREFRNFNPSIELSLNKIVSLNLGYENRRLTTGYQSIQRSSGTGYVTEDIEVYSVSGWAIRPELRFFPATYRRPAPFGFFIAPYVRYGQMTEVYEGVSWNNRYAPAWVDPNVSVATTGRALHYGLALGYKANVGVLALEFLAGVAAGDVQYATPNDRDHIPPAFMERSDMPLIPRIEIGIGFVIPKFTIEKKKKNSWGPAAPETDSTLGMQTKVIIYRPHQNRGKVTTYDLYVNDSAAVQLKNGIIFEMKRPSGYYTFSGRIAVKKSMSLFLDPGKVYYIRCGVNTNPLVDEPLIELVSPEEGKYDLSNLSMDR